MGRCSLCVLQVLYVSMFTAYLLSCPFPLSPGNGGVTVTDIHPGGQAHFHCDPGFQVRGHEVATCVNATVPRWSTAEPQCVGQCHASCGDLNVIFRDFHSGFFFSFFLQLCLVEGGFATRRLAGYCLRLPHLSATTATEATLAATG